MPEGELGVRHSRSAISGAFVLAPGQAMLWRYELVTFARNSVSKITDRENSDTKKLFGHTPLGRLRHLQAAVLQPEQPAQDNLEQCRVQELQRLPAFEARLAT